MKTTLSKNTEPHWLDSWHVSPSADRNYDFIDGLRGVAILMVIICHHFYFNPKSGLLTHFLGNLAGTMGYGVQLFFTLSGFLISWPFWRRKVNCLKPLLPPGYAQRRFWKIYPPLALSILIWTPVFILWRGEPTTFITAAVQWLTGLAFVVPVSGKLNPVMWSLVVEVHFYLILPLLFSLTKMFSARVCLWIISLSLLVIPVSIQLSTGFCPTFFPEICDPFFTGLSCFCFGVALAGLENLKIWDKAWAWVADMGWLAVLGGLLGLACLRTNPGIAGEWLSHACYWTFLLGTGCLLCYATDSKKIIAQWLCNPWLRWCGIISYEWYLFHQPLLYLSREFIGPANGSFLRYLLVIGLPLVVGLGFAALVYRMFSLPVLKYGRAKKLSKN